MSMDMDEAYDLHLWDQIRDELEFRDYATQSGEVVCTEPHVGPWFRGECQHGCGAQT